MISGGSKGEGGSRADGPGHGRVPRPMASHSIPVGAGNLAAGQARDVATDEDRAAETGAALVCR
ncbi:hypothetical protein Maq22A_c06420 [Methylobacterium aquaticum]|uniref:Uncharacterized protein n=1 Tax=Methylobacterium aquaticum TaxID=270351 RepID=A0A0C6FHQ7_9HYPH|nr:hypothetical protein Maq22A_c06420 [Methylobacterium aquaticum]